MNKDLLDKLEKGLQLEKSNQFIPWKAPFDNLRNYSNQETLKQSDQRTDLIFKNESILNGLAVDLTIMRWFGLWSNNKGFTLAFAYVTEEDLKSTRIRLDDELGQKGKFKKISAFEYNYIWNLEACKIILSQKDRFGPFWEIVIRYKTIWWRKLT
jgi:hypothetical protein